MYIDDKENIFNNNLLLGTFEGFVFKPSDNYQANQEIDDFITESFIKKIDKLINEGDAALRLNESFSLTYNDSIIAQLLPTDDIFKPDFTPILDDRIQGIPLARLALHLESWLKRQLNSVCDPLDILTKTEDLSEDSVTFIKAITEYLGYAPRYKIDAIVKKITPNDRTKLRKAGVRFAQYSIFVRDMLKPSAQKIKLILWALKNNIPLPELPPSGVVTIPFNSNVPDNYYDIAGYKICGDYCVRADMIEKLADAIRPLALKSESNPNGEFEITAQHMSFIGKSGDVFDTVLKSLGYNYRLENVNVMSVASVETTKSLKDDSEISSVDGNNNIEQEKILENSQNTEDLENKILDPKDSNVVITEKQIEKKIWFWSPVIHKQKREFKKTHYNTDKPKIKFNKFSKDSKQDNPNDTSESKENHFKSKDSNDKFKNFKKDSFDKTDNTFEKHQRKDFKNDKRSKPKPHDNKKDMFKDKQKNNNFTDQNSAYSQKPAPYVNMPKTHKIAAENNPFAALLALKK